MMQINVINIADKLFTDFAGQLGHRLGYSIAVDTNVLNIWIKKIIMHKYCKDSK